MSKKKKQKYVDPESVRDVVGALVENPRLVGFLGQLNADVPRTVDLALKRFRPAREAAIASYYIAEGHVQDMGSFAAQDQRVACGAGCWWCCTKIVQVTAPEVLLVARYIRQWPQEAQEVVIARARGYVSALSGLPQQEWPSKRLRCPLLADDGKCSVYPARPLICRAWNSLDAGICRTQWARRWAPGGPKEEMVFEYTTIVQTIQILLRHSIREKTGIEIEHLVFGPALYIALTEPDAEQRWLAGEDIFASAKWELSDA